jgi:phage/plasmid-associated DNA primase
LFFKIGKLDNWQLCPLLLGDSNTGKGTIVKLVSKMFPKQSVGVITAGKESLFGLESLRQRRVVMIPDMPRQLGNVLAQSDFQSMISGEPVNIARKNKVSISDEDWTVPLFAASNYYPEYKDESGAISRRLLVFGFKVLVTNRDTTLFDRIVNAELVVVMLRCLEQYRCMRLSVGSGDPWDSMPLMLKQSREDVKINTNPLASFLENGDAYYQVVYREECITPLEDLNRAYSNYMKFSHGVKVSGIGSDYFPLKSKGYVIKTVKLCKECRQPSSKEGCGEHYNVANRSNKVVICNMFVDKNEVVEEE